jgi:hypothetical protein
LFWLFVCKEKKIEQLIISTIHDLFNGKDRMGCYYSLVFILPLYAQSRRLSAFYLRKYLAGRRRAMSILPSLLPDSVCSITKMAQSGKSIAFSENLCGF